MTATAPSEIYVASLPAQETQPNLSTNTPSIYIRTSLSSFIITLLSATIGWLALLGINYIISPPNSIANWLDNQLLILSTIFIYLALAQLVPYRFLLSIRYNLLFVFIGTLFLPVIAHFTGMNRSMPTASRYFSNLTQSFGVYGIITKGLLWLYKQRSMQETE